MSSTDRKTPASPEARPDGRVTVDTSDSRRRSDDDLALPHERDQGATPSSGPIDPVIAQAHQDIASGQVDTDLRATPGLDAERRKRLVPGP